MSEENKSGPESRSGCLVAIVILAILIAMGWWKTQGG
jgi:hypothetical protein